MPGATFSLSHYNLSFLLSNIRIEVAAQSKTSVTTYTGAL